MTKFKTVSLADRVFDKLEDDIICGVYPRGEILTEQRLAEELGISRTPIREALRRLEHESLIEETGKGSLVLGITREDIIDIFNIRYEIEALAAAYAAQNRTEEERAEMQRIMDLQEFYAQKHDLDYVSNTDSQFHEMILNLSHHKLLHDTMMPLLRKSAQYRRASLFSSANPSLSVVEEHRAIADAITAGNPEAALKAEQKHIRRAIKRVLGEELKK